MRNADALHNGSGLSTATVCGFDNLCSVESATFIRYFFLVIGRTTPLELTNGNNMTSEFVTRIIFTRTTAGTRGTTSGDTTATITSTKLIMGRQCCSGTVGSFNTRDSSSQLGLLVTNSRPQPCSRPLVYPPPLKPTCVTANETQPQRYGLPTVPLPRRQPAFPQPTPYDRRTATDNYTWTHSSPRRRP